ENMTTAPGRRAPMLRDERGIALIVAVLALFCLTGLLAAYLSVATLEPQISRNLADVSRARHLAEAGIERGFNVLVSTADGRQSWSGLLAGATTGQPWVALAGLTNVAIRGATNGGTFSVSIRNDNGVTDTPLTGLSGTTDGGDDAGTASGTGCDAAANWTVTAKPLKYGMATQPGIQAGSGTTFEANVEAALDTTAKRNAIKGKSQSTGTYATGLDTVAADSSLTPDLMDDFVNRVASNPATTVLRSTAGCPMVIAGSASGLTNAPGLTNACG